MMAYHNIKDDKIYTILLIYDPIIFYRYPVVKRLASYFFSPTHDKIKIAHIWPFTKNPKCGIFGFEPFFVHHPEQGGKDDPQR